MHSRETVTFSHLALYFEKKISLAAKLSERERNKKSLRNSLGLRKPLAETSDKIIFQITYLFWIMHPTT